MATCDICGKRRSIYRSYPEQGVEVCFLCTKEGERDMGYPRPKRRKKGKEDGDTDRVVVHLERSGPRVSRDDVRSG